MPNTLSKTDPNLLKAVQRLARTQYIWAALLVGLGVFTQLAAAARHPFAGLPFILVGLACARWKEPALLATVAALIALSIPATANSRISILGPDPLPQLTPLSGFETAALALGKLLLVFMAANQFLLLRLLYGTERATSDEPDLPAIPEMVPNRTNGMALWAQGLGVAGLLCSIGALFITNIELESLLRALAELGGSLGALALGLGLGAAFAPTDRRRDALLGVGLGLASYVVGVIILLRLP